MNRSPSSLFSNNHLLTHLCSPKDSRQEYYVPLEQNQCMPVYIDQIGKELVLSSIPKRIVSLVPSQTELLYDLGLGTEVVGITKFCIRPDQWFRSKTRVGGTKQLKIDIIHQLEPDLIIANKEENVKEQIEELGKKYPVWTSDINDLSSACQMIEQLGTITGKRQRAIEIKSQIRENFSRLTTPDSRLTTAYLIWQNPYMTVGTDTFIHSMLEAAGFENVFAKEHRYPETTIGELQKIQPELLLLSSEPFPFTQSHAEELRVRLPSTRVVLVDGEVFSWYGSRLQYAPAYFSRLREQWL